MTSHQVSSLLKSAVIISAAFLAVVPREAAALAVANSTISYSNFAITPSTGVVLLDGPWSFETFARANNSLGQTDSQFTFGNSPGATSAAASVTWANASASARAPGDPPDLAISGTAASSVNIPGCGPAAAFSNSRSTFSNFFTLSGGDNSSSIDVGFAIDISRALNLLTDACGVFAFTETVFTLEVDGMPVLFDERLRQIGPNDSFSEPFSLRLSNTINLASVDSEGNPFFHFLLLEADSESGGSVQLPEPSSLALLLIAGLAALVAAQSRKQPGKR